MGVPADDGVEEEVPLRVVAAEGVELDLAEVTIFLGGALPQYWFPAGYGFWPNCRRPRRPGFARSSSGMGIAGAWNTRRRHAGDQ